MSFYDFCIANGKESLLKSWDAEKNAPRTPEDVSAATHYKAWWTCEKGHSWQTAVFSRTGGSGCPYCMGRLALPGVNDLATKRPDLASQWHPTKNGDLTPEAVTIGSHRRVWWQCDKGHEWQTAIKTRVGGTGCPYCANRVVLAGENDLATTHPELVKQWDTEKNNGLTPQEVPSGTRRKVWWRCPEGHIWQAAISSRVRGAGCPVCAGKVIVAEENDLQTCFPAIAAQWHPTKNGGFTPQVCPPHSNRRVWWRCPLGHDYQAVVGKRTLYHSGCPYCAGSKVLAGFNDLETLEPAVAASWHPTLNGTLTPQDVTTGSRRKVWWLCPEGHAWKAVVYSRARQKKTGCPVCAGRGKDAQQTRYNTLLQDKKTITETV